MDKIHPGQPNALRQPSAPGAASVRVLVVDDDETQLQLACLWLKSLGYAQVGASSPSEAIHRLATEHFDLLFSDIAMPGSMDGVALAKFARERYPDLRLLLASSYASQMLVDMDLPANLLQKPYKKETLANAVALAMKA